MAVRGTFFSLSQSPWEYKPVCAAEYHFLNPVESLPVSPGKDAFVSTGRRIPPTRMNTEQKLQWLDDWSRHELNDILNYYPEHDFDSNGGFYGAVRRTLEPVKGADRSLILTARIMWTYARAFRTLGEPRYLDMAVHARKYIEDRFVDPEYGGAYWMVDSEGNPADDSKYPYGMAFIIYGGAELKRAADDDEGLKLARSMYEQLEAHTLDRDNGGYFETFSRDWKRRDDSFNIPDPSLGSKALNTHLHMIESYTALMLVDDNPRLRQTVGELIEIMTNKLLDRENFHYKPYMTSDWKATDTLFSFGHDIEGAWLLTESAESYGGRELVEKTKPVSVKIADACALGIAPDTGGLYAEADENGITDREMSWWVQSEGAIGFMNAYELTGDERYLDLTLNIVRYIRDHISDTSDGRFREWLMRGDLPPEDEANEYRVNAWKGPYHNGRMCNELIERIQRLRG